MYMCIYIYIYILMQADNDYIYIYIYIILCICLYNISIFHCPGCLRAPAKLLLVVRQARDAGVLVTRHIFA